MIRQNLLLTGDDGYNLTKSLRFRASASAYLNRTPASSGSSTSFTFSFWTKRGALGYNNVYHSGASNANGTLVFGGGNTFNCQLFNSVGANYGWASTMVFRDLSAWYHIVVKGFASSSGNSYGGVELALYVNGVQQTFTGSAYNTPSTTNRLTDTTGKQIGGDTTNAEYYDGYLTDFYYIDGQSLDSSSFGSTNALTGVWQPAKYTGTYGTNGFYLPFTNTTSTSTLGNDFSGNSNTWTVNNISLTAGTTYDSMNDVPTLTSAAAANYCVLNPLNSGGTLSGGNLNYSMGNTKTVATMAMTTGKFYAEVIINSASNREFIIGIGKVNSSFNLFSSGVGYYANDGTKYVDGTNSSYGVTYTAGDVLGIAVNFDSSQVTFYKNNTSQGAITFSSSTEGYTFVLQASSGATSATFSANFGQQPFTYTPPTGFVALNTFNLPTSTIVKGNTVMDATTFTGNSSTQSIVNTAGFKPDLVWIKERSSTSSNTLSDSVRGAGSILLSDSTAAESTGQVALTSFNTNGFSVGADGKTNESSQTYVGWQWQAGQGTTSSNTSGSITSTVSVNATAGFSVVTYTGNGTASSTVGHGLGVTPNMIIAKVRSTTESWPVFHSSLLSLGTGYFIELDSTGAAGNGNSRYPAAPSSSVVTIGSAGNLTPINASGQTYVMYCFAAVSGYSAFGSYTGNGSTDGPFVYLGFRPRFVIIKQSSSAGNPWVMYDTSRSTYNVISNTLRANDSAAEDTVSGASGYDLDILSNGFKVRVTWGGANTSSSTYIYACFAENPFKNALAR